MAKNNPDTLKRYRAANIEKVREWNRLSYNRNRVKRAAAAHEYRKNNRDVLLPLQNAAQKKYRQKRRREAIAHYGGACACCGETIFEFLGIDHINNDGALHRKQAGVSGSGIYLWLKKHGYPDGFQVLCHNCNLAKGFYGVCPHKTCSTPVQTKLTKPILSGIGCPSALKSNACNTVKFSTANLC